MASLNNDNAKSHDSKDKENSPASDEVNDELNNVDDKDGNEDGEDDGGENTEGEDEGNTNSHQEAENTAVEPAQSNEVQQTAQQPAQPQVSGWAMMKTLAIRMVVIYFISSMFRRSQTPTPPQGAGDTPTGGSFKSNSAASNLFPKNSLMDMYVYITDDAKFTDFGDKSSLFWFLEELEYGDWTAGVNGDGIYTRTGQISISEKVQNNGSLYMHVFIVKAGNSPDPQNKETYSKINTIYRSRELTKLKKRKFHTMKNLLTGTSEVQADLIRQSNESAVEILSHWHPNFTINLIDDHTAWVQGSVPAPLDEFIEFVPGGAFYYPVVYFNDYWNLNSEYMPINKSTPVLNLTLTYQPLSLFKWQMYAAQSMRNRWYSFLGEDFTEGSDEDQDSLKQAFLETSPYLLGITVVVSIVHSVFEFLAFKNDIQFWRNRKSLEGLSVRSVFFNVFQSVVVLLYVLDNETNFVVKISIFVGLCIEIWKIQKVVDIKLDRENKLFGVIPMLRFQDKSTYTESQTKKYDMLAFKYLSWLLFPLLGCYAVYSVLYQEHKGWYSWVLSMLYGFLLTFGFITMTPQLFINYKLKSVAHLPWRMLTYKALNTFIDDLFAFVIKMPMLYRLGCFRDDIIFLIYVYQRWIYRVDPKRVNEFGTSGEMHEENSPNGTAAIENIQAAIEDSSEAAAKNNQSASPSRHQKNTVKSGAAKKKD